MLVLKLGGIELFDERLGEFIQTKEATLQLEHSLISLSKWESKWHKPFLSKDDKTYDEIIDYVRCMTISQNVDLKVYYALKRSDLESIEKYLADPMTATVISKAGKKTRQRAVTSELIYSWMVTLGIPFTPCEKWNLNRLLTLIDVCNIENSPKKRMKNRDILKQNSSLNAQRKRAMGTRG